MADEKFLMYPPSMLAAASVCAAFTGLATEEQKSVWTRPMLFSFLQGLTNIEPVRIGKNRGKNNDDKEFKTNSLSTRIYNQLSPHL